jgi:hypothetical protein
VDQPDSRIAALPDTEVLTVARIVGISSEAQEHSQEIYGSGLRSPGGRLAQPLLSPSHRAGLEQAGWGPWNGLSPLGTAGKIFRMAVIAFWRDAGDGDRLSAGGPARGLAA